MVSVGATVERLSNHFGILVVLACVLAGCTSARTYPDRTDTTDTFFSSDTASSDAEGVITAGFNHIARKYINEIDIPPMALESLRGLSTLDPGVSVREEDGYVSLSIDQHDIISMPSPASDDTEGWAHLITLATLEARRQSTDIQNADIEKIYETIFDSALSTLDIYSRYAGADEAGSNRAKRDGYGGIGIRFKIRNDTAVITHVVEGSPSDRAGILVNDIITHVDGKSISGLGAKTINSILRGPTDSGVSVTYLRESEGAKEQTLTRTHIIPTTVIAERQDEILYIRVKSFNQDTVRSFSRAISQALATSNPLHGLIVDLRGNPGGLLKQSIEMADTLLIQGDILNTSGRHPDSIQHYEAVEGDIAQGLPLVVLIDGRSASASEIVAAALQDQSRAVILGTASYGKGTVQTVVRLPNDGEMTLTWSRFMAPSGYALHGLGVLPVICTSSSAKPARSNETDIRAALDASEGTTGVLEAWRETPLTQTDERRDLRTHCPPEQHTSTGDIDLARLLIENAQLYNRALAMSARHQVAAE